MEVRLPYDFVPRDYQLGILDALDSGCKRLVWVVHRRAGKDLVVWNWVIKRLIERKGICYYIFPTYSQAKKVIWQSQTRDGRAFLSYIPQDIIRKKSESELAITFVNGSLLQLVGSENVDRLVGTAPSIVVFSESALHSPRVWDLVRPILTENDGVAMFISTPRGKNWFYDLFQMAKTNPDWFCETLTVEDTGAIPLGVIQDELDAGMSEELVKQEFYVSWIGLEGSYYIRDIDKMRMDGRILHVVYDPTALVHTAWDLGIGDDMAIIWYQIIHNEIHVIDCYANSGHGLEHYARVLQDKGYLYGNHYAPHDIDNRELGTGISRKEVAKQLGINFQTLPTLRIKFADGIEVVRGMFPRVWIDDQRCKQLIVALENYRKEFDSRHGIYNDTPCHDKHSHYADAYRYAMIACRMCDTYKGGMSKEEILRRNDYNRRMRG